MSNIESWWEGYQVFKGQVSTGGTSGYSGYSGQSGFSGYSGFSGSGISGYSGESGYSGANGVSGISGFSGYSGSGISGYSGRSGFSGANGVSGTSGYSGYSGSGISGYSGFSGYSGAVGASIAIKGTVATVANLPSSGNLKNDAYVVTADSHLYVWTGSAWSDAGQFTGTSGFSGFSGFSGYSGKSGFSGYSGINGTNGASGFSGAAGASGFSGYSGINGLSGVSGFSGQVGGSGISGYSGFSGYSGSGVSGYSGKSGFSGISGFSGYSGASASSLFVSIKDFGAVGNGTTNDTTAIQNALNSLGTAGGSVYVPNNYRCLVSGSLTIPKNVSLVGPHLSPGMADYSPTSFNTMGGAILLSSAATINLSGSSAISGLLIYRAGMTFPISNTSGYAGTAITGSYSDCTFVENCIIIGFNQACRISNSEQLRFNNLWLDNINGIEISGAPDVCYISNCHAWPFASRGGTDNGTRSGTAFYYHDVADWIKTTNCFSYGYAHGFEINNVNSAQFIGCGADNLYTTAPGLPGSIGFNVLGTSTGTVFSNCQAAAQDYAGFHFSASSVFNEVVGCSAWGNYSAIIVNQGNVDINSCLFNGNGLANSRGIAIGNAASIVNVDNCNSNDMVLADIEASVSTTLLSVANTNSLRSSVPVLYNGNLNARSIASASTITIPTSVLVCNVTGTTTINNVLNGWAGRQITLIFNGALTVVNSATANTGVRLKGSTNFSVSAGVSLTLVHNGTQWFEIGRNA
jgi:hypothetical protein